MDKTSTLREERKGKPSLNWLFGPPREETHDLRYKCVRGVSINGWMVEIWESDPVRRMPKGRRESRITHLYYDREEYHISGERIVPYNLR